MEVISTRIAGLKVIKPSVFNDKRGYFYEGYNAERYALNQVKDIFVQDNISASQYGVIRGLHYQLAPYSQAKLVTVLKGAVLDVAVDLRKGSPTFGQYESIILSEDNKIQFYIPQGFAHGFSVLSEDALFFYKCNQYYNQEAERGINYNDPHLAIDWQIPVNKAIISPKDNILPSLQEAEINFAFQLL
jgi:dTDP-4-dehydrorhamnose 3,5-epimerase